MKVSFHVSYSLSKSLLKNISTGRVTVSRLRIENHTFSKACLFINQYKHVFPVLFNDMSPSSGFPIPIHLLIISNGLCNTLALAYYTPMSFHGLWPILRKEDQISTPTHHSSRHHSAIWLE